MVLYSIPHDLTNWIPIPAILVVGVVVDIIGACKGRFGLGGWWRIDNVGHLGGYASGIVAALAIKHRARRRKETHEMKEESLEPVNSLEIGRM